VSQLLQYSTSPTLLCNSSHMAVVAMHSAGKANMADGPTLNCEDLPEADIYALGRGPVSFRNRGAHGYKASKPRMKLVGMPALSEMQNEMEDITDFEPQQWRCKACTVLNNALLPRCEVCETKRSDHVAKIVQGNMQKLAEAPFIGSTPSLDWPALPEAWELADSWIDCDVSSVASSWLDIGGTDEHADDDHHADVILVTASGGMHMQAPKPVGPPLWSAIVGQAKDAATFPVRDVAVPPAFSRRPSARPRTKSIEEDDHDDQDIALDVLHERRMHGTGKCRPVKQNKTMKK